MAALTLPLLSLVVCSQFSWCQADRVGDSTPLIWLADHIVLQSKEKEGLNNLNSYQASGLPALEVFLGSHQ